MCLNLFYYIRILIREGHEAQYQNMNGTGKKPIVWFSLPQIIFIIISAMYVYFNKEGLSSNVIDYILSALSIMSALFMSLIVIILDKLKTMKFKGKDGNSNVHHLHTWHNIKQFASITSYATLLSLLLICILIGSLLWGKSTDINDVQFVPFSQIDLQSIKLGYEYCFVCVVRFLFCYFLLDFLLMTLYAISLIFQSINTDLQLVKPFVNINENKEEKINDTITYEFGKYSSLKWVGFVIIFVLFSFIYVLIS